MSKAKPKPIPATPLSDLAIRITAEHALVASALATALGHAIACGELLIEAKRKVQHGEWRPWLETNCTVPARTARHYMALARQRKKLCDQNGNVLPLSVNEAVETLKELGKTPWPTGYDPDEMEMEEWPSRRGKGHRCSVSYGLNQAFRGLINTAVEMRPTPEAIATLREASTLLARCADALEAKAAKHAVPRPVVGFRREGRRNVAMYAAQDAA